MHLHYSEKKSDTNATFLCFYSQLFRNMFEVEH